MLFNLLKKKQIVLPVEEDTLAVIALIVDVVKMALFEYHNFNLACPGAT
jgi:hypothetical protein